MANSRSDLIRRYEGSVLIEFSYFALFDFFDYSSLSDIGIPANPEWVGQSGMGGAVFHATDSNLEALVSVELWSTEPPSVEINSSHSCFGGFSCSSGKVLLTSVTGGPDSVVVELEGPGEYDLAAVRLPEVIDTLEGDEGRCEQWKIYVWQR